MLGKLKKIELRKAWKHEAADFTNWLAEEENLALLSDEIGIDIRLLQTEASVGKFNVDILAEEEKTGRKVIIENQLEMTNHAHLGQLITYASGHNAGIIIWIVRGVRDEHKQAVDWLNEHSDEEINLFLIKMELWQIGDSAPAPKFHIISQPNDWAKAVKKMSVKSELTETKLLQLEFWNKFKEYANSRQSKLRLRKALAQHWYDMSVGSSDAHMSLTVNTRENLIACEIYIPDSIGLFNKLKENKDKIETDLKQSLKWLECPGRKASRIKVVSDADITQIEKWGDYFEWLLSRAQTFQKVFPKYIKKVG